MNETRTIGLPRRAVSFAAATGLALAGTITLASGSQGAPGQTEQPKKVYVCKYVGKPGVDERLQTGQNPIQVSVNAIPGPGPVKIGYEFADAQGRSLVIGFVTDKKTEPAPECPQAPPPSTTTSTTSSSSSSSSSSSTTSTSTKTTPAGPKTTSPGGKGGGVTPGVAAPKTGGSGEDGSANTLLGSGLLLAAGGVLASEALRRRREIAAHD